MTTDLPSPHTTLAILLGASRYPKYATWGENPAFARSARAFRDYLLAVFGLRHDQLLDLFDSDDHAAEVTRQIRDFLKSHVADADKPARPRDAIVYYVGHGCFDEGRRYCLSLNATDEEDIATSSLPASSLRKAVDTHGRHLRRYYIMDCCFAREMLKSLMTNDTSLSRKFWDGPAPEGFALLSATSHEDVAFGEPTDEFTLFSGAVVEALRQGDPRLDERLTLAQVCELRHARDSEPGSATPPDAARRFAQERTRRRGPGPLVPQPRVQLLRPGNPGRNCRSRVGELSTLGPNRMALSLVGGRWGMTVTRDKPPFIVSQGLRLLPDTDQPQRYLRAEYFAPAAGRSGAAVEADLGTWLPVDRHELAPNQSPMRTVRRAICRGWRSRPTRAWARRSPCGGWAAS